MESNSINVVTQNNTIVVVEPTHTPVLPVIEATVGSGVTVTAVAADVVVHPFKSVTVTV